MKKGQILLIVVMLLATVMTVVLSVSFKSVTETQVTKLEEESQKAFAAAEAAIEVALKENQNVTIGAGSLSSITGFEGTATIETAVSNRFTSPSIVKNGSYTFYLGDYNALTGVIGASTAQDVAVCFQTGSPKPAVEITLVKTSGVKKYVVDPDARISNASSGSFCSSDPTNYSYSVVIPGADVGGDGKFLLLRVLYAPSKLFFSAAGNLPIQGRTINSSAKSSTSTGVSKKVTLFQNHPQIPGEFFSTSF